MKKNRQDNKHAPDPVYERHFLAAFFVFLLGQPETQNTLYGQGRSSNQTCHWNHSIMRKLQNKVHRNRSHSYKPSISVVLIDELKKFFEPGGQCFSVLAQLLNHDLQKRARNQKDDRDYAYYSKNFA